MLLRLRKTLKRLDLRPKCSAPQPEPMDRAWRDMLDRVDARHEGEKRLTEVERALNSLR